MCPANAGGGYRNANETATADGYTYVDNSVSCDSDGWVTTIKISVSVNAGTLEIGCGTLVGTLFTPRNHVTIDSGGGIGEKVFIAGVDFESFQMLSGDFIYAYSVDWEVIITRTSTAPLGYGYIAGDAMELPSFTVNFASTRGIEFEFEGVGLGWADAEVDGQDPSDIETVENQELADIDKINKV